MRKHEMPQSENNNVDPYFIRGNEINGRNHIGSNTDRNKTKKMKQNKNKQQQQQQNRLMSPGLEQPISLRR